jgi:hypothetical protein
LIDPPDESETPRHASYSISRYRIGIDRLIQTYYLFTLCSIRELALPLIREFRLSPPSKRQGVSCDENGAFIGTIPLLERTRANGKDRWLPIDGGELSEQISSHLGLPIDMSRKIGGLRTIASALNSGDVARAQIATVLLGIPDPPRLSKTVNARDEMIKFISDLHWSGMIKADWDPDEHPRWPAGAPDSQGGQFAPKSDSDECGINAPIRRRWERAEGRDWPRDAQGRRYDVSHIKARADGGTDDLDNITPKPHDEHVREHMQNGDFSRWGKRRLDKLREQMNTKSGTATQPNKPGSVKPENTTTPQRTTRSPGTAKPTSSPKLGTPRTPRAAPSGSRGTAPRLAPEATPEAAPELTPEEPVIPEEIIPEEIPIIIPE